MASVKVHPDRIHEIQRRQEFTSGSASITTEKTKVWIKIHKLDSGLEIDHPQGSHRRRALLGRIDAVRKSFDDKSYLQRYTPRGKKSTGAGSMSTTSPG